MWFSPAEAQFRRSHHITDEATKYDHVLMKLPKDVIMTVRSRITEIEADPRYRDTSYQQLKAALLGSYTVRRRKCQMTAQLFQRIMDKLFRLLPFLFSFHIPGRPCHRQAPPRRTFVVSSEVFSGSPWQWFDNQPCQVCVCGFLPQVSRRWMRPVSPLSPDTSPPFRTARYQQTSSSSNAS